MKRCSSWILVLLWLYGATVTAANFASKLPTSTPDPPEGSWTMVVLSDTQYYAQDYPAILRRQVEWIAHHKKTHNIRFVIQEGDLTNHNGDSEWKRVSDAMRILEEAKVPYVITTGNHDYPYRNFEYRDRSKINWYFSMERCERSGAMHFWKDGKVENTAYEYEINGKKLLVIALEYYPRNSVVEWADKIIADHPSHMVMIVTHAYLRSNGTRWRAKADNLRYPEESSERPNNGVDMWGKLFSKHENIRFVFCGHVTGRGSFYRADKGAHGNIVHQLLTNYQRQAKIDDGSGHFLKTNRQRGASHRPHGGGGFLRMLQFLPDGETVRVKTYSPWYDRCLRDADQEFEFKINTLPVNKK